MFWALLERRVNTVIILGECWQCQNQGEIFLKNLAGLVPIFLLEAVAGVFALTYRLAADIIWVPSTICCLWPAQVSVEQCDGEEG